jgi:SAM-dependent methyltransferase
MYHQLKRINERPIPWECYTAETLWNDPHTSKQMLDFHLNPDLDPASRNKAVLDRSIAWMTDYFKIENGLRVADFGCGPGFYTRAFAASGAAVTGIDVSARSIAHARDQARAKGLAIDYVRQNYLAYGTDKRFDLMTIIYCDLCALGPEQRKALFGIFHKHLADNGRLFLDVFSLHAFNQRLEAAAYAPRLMDGFWSEGDYYGFINTIKYDDEKVMLDKYTIVEPSKTWEVYNWLQYYSTQSLAAEFEDNGFDIVAYFSDVTGTPYQDDADVIAVVAEKIN